MMDRADTTSARVRLRCLALRAFLIRRCNRDDDGKAGTMTPMVL
jgi:hypothetical protein